MEAMVKVGVLLEDGAEGVERNVGCAVELCECAIEIMSRSQCEVLSSCCIESGRGRSCTEFSGGCGAV